MKKFITLILGFCLTCSVARAGFEEHYNLAQQYLGQYQYSSAISEFKKALRINYLDNSARIGLVNSYLARGTYFANNDKDWEKAANDYRAALFYLKYYTDAQNAQNSSLAISNAVENLNQCLAASKFNTSPQSRYQTARALRAQGLFAEAAYEFNQALADNSLKKDSYEQAGDILKVLGNDPKASEYYQKAVAINPNDAGLRLKYARVLDKLGQDELAVQEYNYVLAKSGDNVEITYALEKIYRRKLEQSPKDAEILANLGAILQKQNKYDEALNYYSKAEEINPSNVTTRLNLGTLYQQKKDYEKAIAAYDTILILYPDNVQANYYKAQCLAASGQKTAAIELFKKVLNIDPTNKNAKNDIFDLMKDTMTPAQMLAYMSNDSQVDSQSVEAIYDYAIELHKQKKLDDAIACYNEVLKTLSDNPEVYVNLAIAYKQKNNLAEATKILQGAKTKFPSNKQIDDNLKAFVQEVSSAKYDEASKYFNSNNFQGSLAIYQSIKPETFDSLMGMAACYKALNNSNQAIESYKKALNLNPNNSDVAYFIGVLYSEQENWSASKVYLKKAIQIDKNNTRADDLLGSVIEQANIKLLDKAIDMYEAKDYQNSLKLISQILTEDSKNAYAYYYRGLIYDDEKKYLQASVEYKKVLQLTSELPIAHYLLALDYDNLKQFKAALASYKKFVSLTAENNEFKKYAQSRIKELRMYE